MRHEVKLSDIGDEAGRHATVAFWHIDEGEEIEEGDDLVEMVTDKAAFNVASPKSGVVIEKLVQEGDQVAVKDVLCIIEF